MRFCLIISFIASAFFTQLIAQKGDTTFVAAGNPIIKHKFTADPAALVYKDKVYIYTGSDVPPEKRNGYECMSGFVFLQQICKHLRSTHHHCM